MKLEFLSILFATGLGLSFGTQLSTTGKLTGIEVRSSSYPYSNNDYSSYLTVNAKHWKIPSNEIMKQQLLSAAFAAKSIGSPVTILYDDTQCYLGDYCLIYSISQ
jgi:sialic acid synthase SpsE